MAVAQFLNIGASTAIDLNSIVPIGDSVADNVQIQTLTPGGATKDSYTWNDWVADTPCWVDDSLAPVSGVSFEPGQGLFILGTASTQGIQTSGEVGASDIVVQLQNGGTATGNPFPVEVALSDVIPEGDSVADNVQIQTLTPGGATKDSYTWNDWVADTPCWVDDSLMPVTGVVFGPGEGLFVLGTSTSQTLRFPAPEL